MNGILLMEFTLFLPPAESVGDAVDASGRDEVRAGVHSWPTGLLLRRATHWSDFLKILELDPLWNQKFPC